MSQKKPFVDSEAKAQKPNSSIYIDQYIEHPTGLLLCSESGAQDRGLDHNLRSIVPFI